MISLFEHTYIHTCIYTNGGGQRITITCLAFRLGNQKKVCKIWSHALEFGSVRLPLANDKKSPLQDLESCTRVWLGKTPLANGKEKSRLKHIGSFTGVWLGKTPLLLMGTKKMFATLKVMHLSLVG